MQLGFFLCQLVTNLKLNTILKKSALKTFTVLGTNSLFTLLLGQSIITVIKTINNLHYFKMLLASERGILQHKY